MGCGCGKKTNSIRMSNSNKASQTKKAAANAKEARKNRLKMIRINATKKAAPRKQK